MKAIKRLTAYSFVDGEILIHTEHPLYNALDSLLRWGLLPRWIGLEWDDCDSIPF